MDAGDTVVGTNAIYVVQAADADSTNFTLRVTRANNSGHIASLPMLAGTAGITGILQAGQTLTTVTTGLGGSGAISHQWMRGTAVVGTNATYTVQAADVGTNFTLRVTRANNTGHVASLPMLTGTVSITGIAQVNNTLTANVGGLGGSGATSFQWRRGTVNIGTNSSSYTVQAADEGSAISVRITRASNTGHVTSSLTATVPTTVP